MQGGGRAWVFLGLVLKVLSVSTGGERGESGPEGKRGGVLSTGWGGGI